ncbi:Methyltransferase [Aspergillus sp. HF37]|nr:Methyltransferase [Aspergillus sp. HF37]
MSLPRSGPQRASLAARTRPLCPHPQLEKPPLVDVSLTIARDTPAVHPRPETESYTFHTAELVRKNILRRGGPPDSDSPAPERPLRVLDLCTGTGCIALLLHALLVPHYPHMAVLGIDLSTAAIELANRNLEHNLQRGLLSSRARSEVHFRRGNVLGDQSSGVPGVEEVLRDVSRRGCPLDSTLPAQGDPEWDVLISNPPYISPSSFRDGTTARSVRIFEPTLALVPPTGVRDPEARNCSQGDLFYHRIVALSFKLRPRLSVLECGDRVQAERVVAICRGFMEDLSDRSHIDVYPSADEGDVSQAQVG